MDWGEARMLQDQARSNPIRWDWQGIIRPAFVRSSICAGDLQKTHAL